MWNDASKNAPESGKNILLTDGEGGFCVGFHNGKHFESSNDLLTAEWYDGSCHIELFGHSAIKWWAEIPPLEEI